MDINSDNSWKKYFIFCLVIVFVSNIINDMIFPGNFFNENMIINNILEGFWTAFILSFFTGIVYGIYKLITSTKSNN